jgi:phage shock protein PspC (stress-responsive transcriptional regulator)
MPAENVLAIRAGDGIILRTARGPNRPGETVQSGRAMQIKETLKRMGRSDNDQMLGGVCAGIAETTETPPWLWRAGALLSLVFYGTGIPIYVVLWLVMPLRSKIT